MYDKPKMRVHERIRQIIEQSPNLSQRGLAEHMGLDPSTVNRMLHGERKIVAEEIPVIEDYIRVKLDLQYPQEARSPAVRARGFAEGGRAGVEDPFRVPVYGYAAGSRPGGGGLNLSNGDVVDWAPRHPAQMGIRDAFAVYVVSDSMEPRYYRGELIYVHPGRPPDLNRDCVIEMLNGDAYIKRLLRHGGDRIRVQQYNPPEETDILLKDIKRILAVIGRG